MEREQRYPAISSDQLAWKGTLTTVRKPARVTLTWHQHRKPAFTFPSLKWKIRVRAEGKKKYPSAKRNIAGQIRGGQKSHIRMRRNTAALKLIWACVFCIWLFEPTYGSELRFQAKLALNYCKSLDYNRANWPAAIKNAQQFYWGSISGRIAHTLAVLKSYSYLPKVYAWVPPVVQRFQIKSSTLKTNI